MPAVARREKDEETNHDSAAACHCFSCNGRNHCQYGCSKITSDLSGIELVSWVYAIYMLTTAVSTPIYGKLADLFGRKKLCLLELLFS